MIKYISLLLLFFSINILAQRPLNFEFDYARYAYNEDTSFVEFYYSFDQNDLKVINKDNGKIVRAILGIQITDSISGKIVLNRNWKVENPITDSAGISQNKNLIGIVSFLLPKGKYICTLSGVDASDSTRRKEIVENIPIESFLGSNISLSDIELATNIQQENADPSSIFFKNTLEVLPNPSMIYGEGFPVLFYYMELYNLKTLKPNLMVKTMLFNSRGIRTFEKSKDLINNNNSRVEVGTINISKYPTDTYTIIVTIIDSSMNIGVSSAKRFYIFNPSVQDTFKNAASNDVLSSQYGVLSSEECDLLFKKAKYITSSAESDQYEKLETVESKRDFLFNFWRKRDTNPVTPENEYYNEYMKRVNISDERYGTLNRAGMKTDRGRILILYGEPDEIDRYPNDLDKKPYEVWQYNQIEGGVIFIFGDVTGFSNYELLHSTKRGELRDDNWQRRIQTN